MNSYLTKVQFMRNRKGPIRNTHTVHKELMNSYLTKVQLMSNRKGPIRNTLTIPYGIYELIFDQSSVYEK